MKKFILTIILLLATTNVYAAENLSHITGTGGTVYFADDFESGYDFLTSADRYGGSYGYYSMLGGLPTGSEGTGCSDNNSYHNTIISTDAAAQSAIPESTHALKTPYSGSCPNESYSRDTTTILLGDDHYELYIRWYQKWTGDWNSASSQQKFTKIYNTGFAGSIGIHFSFSANPSVAIKSWLPNVEGRFDKDGYTVADWSWVHLSTDNAPTYNGDLDSYDDINNQQGSGGTDSETQFVVGQWYCLEMHFKINTDSSTADGVQEMWVDGKKWFEVTNMKFYPNIDRAAKYGVNSVELQHVYYNRSSNDQPTYMDNIVIADKYIGPIGYTEVPAVLPGGSVVGGVVVQ